MINTPSTGAFLLKVEYGTGINYPLQTFIKYSNAKRFRRQFDPFTNIWTPWQEEVFKTEIVNNLTSSATDQPLSANQGRILNQSISNVKNNVTILYDNHINNIYNNLSDASDHISYLEREILTTVGTIGGLTPRFSLYNNILTDDAFSITPQTNIIDALSKLISPLSISVALIRDNIIKPAKINGSYNGFNYLMNDRWANETVLAHDIMGTTSVYEGILDSSKQSSVGLDKLCIRLFSRRDNIIQIVNKNSKVVFENISGTVVDNMATLSFSFYVGSAIAANTILGSLNDPTIFPRTEVCALALVLEGNTSATNRTLEIDPDGAIRNVSAFLSAAAGVYNVTFTYTTSQTLLP